MSLDRATWLGIGFGLVMGLTYGWLQVRELRQRAASQTLRPALAGPGLRLAALVVTLWLVIQLTDANKYWLTGSLAVAYTAPLFWSLTTTTFRKK